MPETDNRTEISKLLDSARSSVKNQSTEAGQPIMGKLAINDNYLVELYHNGNWAIFSLVDGTIVYGAPMGNDLYDDYKAHFSDE